MQLGNCSHKLEALGALDAVFPSAWLALLPLLIVTAPFRYPTYKGHHSPTLNSVQKHQRVTGLKVALAAKLLQLSGKSKQAAALAHGFKTAQVMNTPRYGPADEQPGVERNLLAWPAAKQTEAVRS
jgi:hypothetical protein